MRIAIFYNLPFGGAKRVVREHVKGLKTLGNTIDVYTLDTSHDIFDPGDVADNTFIYQFASVKISLPIFSRLIVDFQTLVHLRSLHKKIASDIDDRRYDIVLVHTDRYTQAPFILRYLKTTNVYYCLEPLRIGYEYSLSVNDSLKGLNKIYERITRRIRKHIDRVNAQSAKNIATLSLFGREYIIHAFNLYPKVLYLGVNADFFRPTKRKRKKQVLFVAEKEYIYGYDLAKEAMNLIPAAVRPELKIVFGTKKTQRVSDEELVKLYAESCVTLSLSRYDTFGLVPLESMACGTPVICLNVAGYRETVRNGETGFLTDFDSQEIADKILYFLQHPDHVETMGRNGRKWIEQKWTWEFQTKQLYDYLVTLVQEEKKKQNI